jgi:broad specificity phosphatase PhoE
MRSAPLILPSSLLLLSFIMVAVGAALGKKTVYLIRHAESEENRRLGSLKSVFSSLGRFSLPASKDVGASFELLRVTSQVDSDLSPVGKLQIQSMGQQLGSADFVAKEGIELVVHSPLHRARQTSHGLLGCLAPDIKAATVSRVEEHGFLEEKYPSEWIPGNYASFTARIAEFETWLNEQTEEKVAVVGHSQYFKAMLGLDFKFRNCDVWQVQFDGNNVAAVIAEEITIEGKSYQLPPQWSSLKCLYVCNVAEPSDDDDDSPSPERDIDG